MRVTLLTGGLGGARLAPALAALCGEDLTVVANVGDDLTWRTLRICPDLDSVLYALAGVWDAERGWGRRDESWQVRTELERRGEPTWFNVGDRDLALHLRRSELLASGVSLTDACASASRDFGLSCQLLPASDQFAGTGVELVDGRQLGFQEWYVRDGGHPEVRRAHLSNAPATPEVLTAIETADLVVLGPSNPVSSIGALMSLGGVSGALARARRVVAVSPVVVGTGSDDPGVAHHALARSRLLAPLGRVDTPESIAGMYTSVCDKFVIDDSDADRADEVRRAGIGPVLAPTLDPGALARVLVGLAAGAPAASMMA